MITTIISIILIICIASFCLRITEKIFKIGVSFLQCAGITIIMGLLGILYYFLPSGIILSLVMLILSIVIFYLILKYIKLVSFRRSLIIYIVTDIFIVIIFAIILLLLKFMLVSPLYTVVGSSMAPALLENDMVIINNMSSIKRGDIVVFVPTGKEMLSIKRVIGLPGETVKINHNHVEICTGQNSSGLQCSVLNESYLSGVNTEARCNLNEFKLNDTGFFVLGDNRGFSTDSRCCFSLECSDKLGYEVPQQNIIGKVFLKLFPKVKFY